MSLPDVILVTTNADAMLRPPGFPHRLALIPGDGPLPETGGRGMWLIDADCGTITLNDPAFEAYLADKVPVTIHCEKLRDLRPFLRRKTAFKVRGYRIEVLP